MGALIGVAAVASRFAVAELGPITLAFLRYAIALLCLAPLALARRARVRWADVPAIALIGIGQFALLITLLNFSMLYIPAGRAALIFGATPLLTLIVAWLIGRETLTGRKTTGIVLCVLGVAAVLSDRGVTANDGLFWIGDLAALGSAVCGAVCSVLYAPYMRRYDAVSICALATLAATAALGLATWWFAGPITFTEPGRGVWLAVLVVGLASAAGYLLWVWALGHAPASTVAAFISLGPIVAAALGYGLLGEPPTWGLIVGLALVTAGLWASSKA